MLRLTYVLTWVTTRYQDEAILSSQAGTWTPPVHDGAGVGPTSYAHSAVYDALCLFSPRFPLVVTCDELPAHLWGPRMDPATPARHRLQPRGLGLAQPDPTTPRVAACGSGCGVRRAVPCARAGDNFGLPDRIDLARQGVNVKTYDNILLEKLMAINSFGRFFS
jgi:hypothetical protein